MTSLPTVSVVVPTRDRPELLRKTIAALDGQLYDGRIEVGELGRAWCGERV